VTRALIVATLTSFLAGACESSRAVGGDAGRYLPRDAAGGGDVTLADAGRDATADAGLACAASGTSCAVSGCCADLSDACLAQGNDRLCLHAEPPPTDGGACNGPASSNLPGVSFTFPGDRCSYTLAEAAAGITVPYQLSIAADLTGVIPYPSDYGNCQEPDGTGLDVGFVISGTDRMYCICDVGLCDWPLPPPTSPRAGTYLGEIQWDGRSWRGPSDAPSPEGPAFPPGTYNLTLTARGAWAAAGGSGDGGSGAADGGARVQFVVTAVRYLTITP
jgi:hypothetical protein